MSIIQYKLEKENDLDSLRNLEILGLIEIMGVFESKVLINVLQPNTLETKKLICHQPETLLN